MRFLFAAAFQPAPNSGAAGSVLAVGSALEALGHSVEYEWEPGAPTRIPHPTASRLLELPGRQLRQVAARLNRAAYDVVIVSQPFAYLVYERLGRRYPRTVFLNRTHGWEARLYDAQHRLGFGEARNPGARLLSGISEGLTRRACRRTARASQAVIAPASSCGEYIRAAYGLPPERVPVIAYGLSEAGRALARAPREPGRRMLFVGNYLPRKGSLVLEGLLPTLAAQFPDSSLTFVTDATAGPQLDRHYRGAFGNRLKVHDWMPRDGLNALYSTHDILLYPSLFEGFGKVWMEAMAAGMCVVGFGEGGLPDVARDGEALMCPAGDVAGLGGIVRRSLENPRWAAEIGRRGRERVQAFSWERAAQETIALCRRLGAP